SFKSVFVQRQLCAHFNSSRSQRMVCISSAKNIRPKTFRAESFQYSRIIQLFAASDHLGDLELRTVRPDRSHLFLEIRLHVDRDVRLTQIRFSIFGESYATYDRPFVLGQTPDRPDDSLSRCVMIGVYAIARVKSEHKRRPNFFDNIADLLIQYVLIL